MEGIWKLNQWNRIHLARVGLDAANEMRLGGVEVGHQAAQLLVKLWIGEAEARGGG